MATVEHEGKDQTTNIPEDYIEKVVNACPISDELISYDTAYRRMMVGLITQQNLLLDKMCNLLMISTGLMDHDISIDNPDSDDTIEKAVGNSMVCNNCSQVVVPDALGYCPKCKTDLRRLMMDRD